MLGTKKEKGSLRKRQSDSSHVSRLKPSGLDRGGERKVMKVSFQGKEILGELKTLYIINLFKQMINITTLLSCMYNV